MNEVEKYLAEWNTLQTDEDFAAFDKKIKADQASRSSDELNEISNQFETAAQKTITEAEELIEELSIKQQLEPILKYASLSTIAKEYFGKSKEWLYQRLNGNLVNGKPAKFTEEEKNTLKTALNDISKKFREVSISLSN